MSGGGELQIEDFLTSLQAAIEADRTDEGKADVEVAGRFNVFDYIKPNENTLSDILVELLHPNGPHGQGSTFLSKFLSMVGVIKTRTDLAGACLRREVITSHIEQARRLDFAIEAGALAIGVENKPWAGDQPDQLNAYADYLTKKYGNQFCLVYLSGDGGKPTSLSESKLNELGSRFRLLSYPTDLRAWLQSCLAECKAQKVQWFLTDFLVYVDENFQLQQQPTGKKGPMARQNKVSQRVVKHALQNLPSLQSTMACVQAFPDIAVAVASDFTRALEHRLKQLGSGQWLIQSYPDADGAPHGERIAITKPGWGSLRVVLAHDRPVPYDSQGSCHVYLQVRERLAEEVVTRPADADSFRTRLIPALTARCGKGRENSIWWPKWYQWEGQYRQWDDPSVLIELRKADQALEYFASALAKMMQAVEEARPAQPLVDKPQ